MEDKILIQSEVHRSVKLFLKRAPIVLFGLAVFFVILLSLEWEGIRYSYRLGEYTVKWTGWKWAFSGFNGKTPTTCLTIFILGCLCLLWAIILGIVYLVIRKCELTVTEKNVKGKTVFGKEVVLPLYMISAYSTRKFLSTIAIATSSGITKFALIKNYSEIGNILSKKINERQELTENASGVSMRTTGNNAIDDLKKLKDLLDAGIITQEEFDAKKKQFLGL